MLWYADDQWAGLTALIEWVERMIAKSAVVKTELHSDYLKLKINQDSDDMAGLLYAAMIVLWF